MSDAELHIALRELVAIGRRGGYDEDEIAEKLARVVHDYAAAKLTEAVEGHYRSVIAGVDVVMADDVLRRARALTEGRANPTSAEKLEQRKRQEQEKERRRLREQVTHLEKKLDIAEQALAGLGLRFE